MFREKGTIKLPRRRHDPKWIENEMKKFPYGYFGPAIKNPIVRKWKNSYLGALWSEARYMEFFKYLFKNGFY